MKEKLNQANSYELKTCFVFLWLSGFCSAAFVVSINWHGMEFASFPIGFLFLICMFEAVRWYRLSLRYLYEDDATETQEDEESATEEAQPIEEVATPSRRLALPTQEDLKKRRQFYVFIHGVCVEKIIGVSAWKMRGIPKAQYEEWMPVLKAAGVIKIREGAAPMIVMNWNEALDAIANLADNQTYWDDSAKYYNATNRSNQMLVG